MAADIPPPVARRVLRSIHAGSLWPFAGIDPSIKSARPKWLYSCLSLSLCLGAALSYLEWALASSSSTLQYPCLGEASRFLLPRPNYTDLASRFRPHIDSTRSTRQALAHWGHPGVVARGGGARDMPELRVPHGGCPMASLVEVKSLALVQHCVFRGVDSRQPGGASPFERYAGPPTVARGDMMRGGDNDAPPIHTLIVVGIEPRHMQ